MSTLVNILENRIKPFPFANLSKFFEDDNNLSFLDKINENSLSKF